jgi:hypothetical protein
MPVSPRRVNAGFFMRVVDRSHSLRVFERGAGETLACGTGLLTVVAGIRLGLLDEDRGCAGYGGILFMGGRCISCDDDRWPGYHYFHGEVTCPDLDHCFDQPLCWAV